MDRRLLVHYKRELDHLRGVGGEFARQFPKIAGRLALTEQECLDPYVERLLEGFAFLAARVHVKLDAEFPRFTQSMLDTVYPHYLAPTPSMAVVQFRPDLTMGDLAEGFEVPRGAVLRSILGKGEQTACEYRTAHSVSLLPLQITQAQYYTRDLSALDLPSRVRPAAGIRLRVQATAGKTLRELALDRLPLYLGGAGEQAMRIYEQVIGHCIGVVVQPPTRPPRWRCELPREAVRECGFSDEEALLPYGPRSFQGYRLLHEYFTIPERFMFVTLTNLRDAFSRCSDTEADILLLLDAADLDLENRVDASCFRLFCAPAINLFPKRCDRIHVTDRFSEFHVVPDRTRPRDFEVYEVQRVTGYGDPGRGEREFRAFYSAQDVDAATDDGAFYAVHRAPRVLSHNERLRGRRHDYSGGEVFLTLVDAAAAPYGEDLRQLGVEALCTNRDLPLGMPVGRGRTDFTMEISAPIESVRCITGPTPPRPSHAEGETAWRLISHLSLNYLSLANSSEQEGASALRDILKLYGELAVPHVRKQIEGVKTVQTRCLTRRVTTGGPIAFARGLEVAVTLDEAAFEGTGVFLLGSILEKFFAKYVSLNSFTETLVRTEDRGEIMRWPARVGRRTIL